MQEKRTRNRKSAPLADRFWPKVARGGPDECWLWTGIVKPNGYGEVSTGNRHLYAHRVSYELAYGPIPEGQFVCHHCDTPLCVRPDHLFIGTHTDNMQDMLAKGRAGHQTKPESRARGDRNGRRLHPERYSNVRLAPRPGELNHAAKLTEEQVREIRRAYAAKEANQPQLATRYGVSQVKISQIVLGKSWRHLL